MNVQSHLFVLAYLPAVLIVWRALGRRLGGTCLLYTSDAADER